MCVCVFFPSILDIKFVGRTSRGHTGGRSHVLVANPKKLPGTLHGGQSRSWSAEQGKGYKHRFISAVNQDRSPHERTLSGSNITVAADDNAPVILFIFAFLIPPVPAAAAEPTLVSPAAAAFLFFSINIIFAREIASVAAETGAVEDLASFGAVIPEGFAGSCFAIGGDEEGPGEVEATASGSRYRRYTFRR